MFLSCWPLYDSRQNEEELRVAASCKEQMSRWPCRQPRDIARMEGGRCPLLAKELRARCSTRSSSCSLPGVPLLAAFGFPHDGAAARCSTCRCSPPSAAHAVACCSLDVLRSGMLFIGRTPLFTSGGSTGMEAPLAWVFMAAW
ncbi:hypothetical protein Dimus_029439 [Dionaea muscipula]